MGFIIKFIQDKAENDKTTSGICYLTRNNK